MSPLTRGRWCRYPACAVIAAGGFAFVGIATALIVDGALELASDRSHALRDGAAIAGGLVLFGAARVWVRRHPLPAKRPADRPPTRA